MKAVLQAACQIFQLFHPITKAFIGVSLVVITLSPISRIAGWSDPDLERAMDNYLSQEDITIVIKDVVILAPIVEEVIYRGPAWAALMLLFILAGIARTKGNPLPWPEKTLFSLRKTEIKVWHAIIWPMIIFPTVAWALRHPDPVTIFAGGMVFGWLLVKTRSLSSVILLHMLWNTLCTISMVIRSLF